MRRTLLMIMAVALLLTQCRKPAVELPTAEPANTVSMTITAGPGGKTDISETGGITWSAGDRIYVGHDGKYVGYLTLVSGQNTPTGTFTGDVTLPNSTTGEQTFHFFYLGSGSQTLTAGESTQATVSFASQTGLRGGLGSCHVGHGSAKGAVSAGGVTGISVMMKSEVALSRFSFKKSGTPEGYPGALTLSGDHIYNSMKVNFGGTFTGEKTGGGEISLTDATSSEKYVMLVPAGATAATLKFDAGAGTTDCNLANGIEANKYYGQGGAIEVMVKVPVPVTGVTLDKSTLPLEVGADYTLTATVAPAGATNKSVTWNSDNTDVATVDGTGKVTAVAAGEATITVTTEDGDKTATCAVTVTAPYLPGEFTVSSGVKVKFSKGNLQYLGSTGTWKFAEHQWDYLGSTTGQGSSTANVDRDLFGWGCTGFQDTRKVNHTNWYQTNYRPYSTSNTSATSGMAVYYNKYGYGPDYLSSPYYNLTVENKSDWGCVTGLPSAGGGKSWRTLSSAEWEWLLGPSSSPTPGTNCRTSSTINGTENARFALVKVDGKCGMMIFPDEFLWPSSVTHKPGTFNTYSSDWNGVDYGVGAGSDFEALEGAGVVFLPAAGRRYGTSISDVGSGGRYWSSSCFDKAFAGYIVFSSGSVSPKQYGDRCGGHPVRLVR